MSGRVEVRSRPMWRSRWSARAPRLVGGLVVAVFFLAGVRAAVAPPAPVAAPVAAASADLGAESFAESFARAYLSWDAEASEQHELQVAAFMSDALEPGGGFSPPARGVQQVVWTAAVADRRLGGGRRVVTVAAQTSGPLVYLAVPVTRDGRGYLSVTGYPAIVGEPATTMEARPPEEDEVEDGQLRAVAERALRNYLAGEATNLRADLDPRAVVSLPAQKLAVASIDEITWALAGRRVAVALEAEDEAGAAWTLRYELDVVRSDRWYVRQIHTDPRKGSTR